MPVLCITKTDKYLNHVDKQDDALGFQRCPLQATIQGEEPREAIFLQHKEGFGVFREGKDEANRLTRIKKYRKESNEDISTNIP